MSSMERREKILDVLCSRRFDLIDNLANEFEVSRRTIRYDIESLSLSYPIYTVQGGGGGVRVADGYYLHSKYFNNTQTELLEKLKQELTGDDLATMESILKTFRDPRRKDK